MEKASKASPSRDRSFPEPIGFFFLQLILNLLTRTLHKLFPRSLSSTLSYSMLCLCSPVVYDDKPKSKNTTTHSEQDHCLRRGDVGIILESIGFSFSKETDQVQHDCMGVGEMCSLFEEEEPSLEEAKEAFCVFDENRDGFIDEWELQRALQKLGFREGRDLNACRKMIAAYDRNRDGKIDFNEFLKFLEISLC
ncbi:putative calcium-binding protein [Ananas comosus]|uniref:Putative calcium-binding protein n=1 Tax=Ananas comosus TaxID=4615 RepID=A0A199UDF2_ANACO|nr:putative calcium-binding protein [Ananas comosus]